MIKWFRMRLAAWISPELARMADSYVVQAKAAMNNQAKVVAQTDALHSRGIKGSVLDYQFWMGWNRDVIRSRNAKVMGQILLPSSSPPKSK